MAKYAHPDVLDNGPALIKSNAERVAVVSAYTIGEAYAAVTANIVAAAATTTTDYTLGNQGTNGRQVTVASKSPTATATSGLKDTGTASSGAGTTLTDSSKTWTVDAYKGRTIQITGGTGSGQTRTIASNTATEITVTAAWTTNPAAGSVYRIDDDLHIVLLDDTNTKVLFVTNETSDQPITSGNVVNIPSFAYKINQPT